MQNMNRQCNTKNINKNEEDLLGSSMDTSIDLFEFVFGNEMTSDQLINIRNDLQMVSYTLESANIPSPYHNFHVIIIFIQECRRK